MIFEMLIAVSETNYIAFVECTHCPLILGSINRYQNDMN